MEDFHDYADEEHEELDSKLDDYEEEEDEEEEEEEAVEAAPPPVAQPAPTVSPGCRSRHLPRNR